MGLLRGVAGTAVVAGNATPRDELDEKLERLETLGQLRTAGVLTEGDFQAHKATVLTD